ncbi:MAG TPA: hypothetical protein VLA92_01760 [Candidatus Saccharimonadales bacterium]|nr:hypothetical protein [Candidatus Saccharimonadales bacterium]
MDSQKQQAAERIKQANNILVTVSNNPSVDQLAACIGLTLTLNKMGKHATAVFSGSTPSTIEFLQPEKTLEKNTDSLRDFIIALDKSKADKLRYKVEDRVVKIFITPYRTSISDKDLEFSQGDFNVDVVLALGVHAQTDLDQAITSHGRILHDATVITVNIKPGGELGSINWLDPNASSLSELGVQLLDALDKKLIDGQIATSFLTGIVAETERFSNSKTSPQTMSISAELMAAGANQQLVATKLEEPAPEPVVPRPAPIASQEGDKPAEEAAPAEKKPDDGTLEITHDEKPVEAESAPVEEPKPEDGNKEEQHHEDESPAPAPLPKPEDEHFEPEAPEEKVPEPAPPQIHIDEHGALSPFEDTLPPKPKQQPPTILHHSEAPKMVLEPPTLGGQLTAAALPGFGEGQEMGSLPQLEAPSLAPPPPIIKDHTMPMGQTIMPDSQKASDDDEAPSGGSAPADSYLVGSSMPVIQPIGPEPQQQPEANPAPKPDEPIPGTLDPARTLPATPGEGRTLSDIEKDVNSPHIVPDAPTPTLPAPEATTPAMPAPADNMLPPLDPHEPIMPETPTPNPAALAPDAISLPDNSAPAMPAPAPAMPPLDSNDMPVFNASAPAPNQPLTNEEHQAASVDTARDAVASALGGASPDANLGPIEALNAQPLGVPNEAPSAPVQPWTPPTEPTPAPADAPAAPQGMPQITVSPDGSLHLPGSDQPAPGVGATAPNSPPPGPPPIMPPTNPF